MPETPAQLSERRRAEAIALLDDLRSGQATLVRHEGRDAVEYEPLKLQVSAEALMVRPRNVPIPTSEELGAEAERIVDAADDDGISANAREFYPGYTLRERLLVNYIQQQWGEFPIVDAIDGQVSS